MKKNVIDSPICNHDPVSRTRKKNISVITVKNSINGRDHDENAYHRSYTGRQGEERMVEVGVRG